MAGNWVRWVVRQQMDSLCRSGFPDDSFLDPQPYWGEYKNRTWGGTNYKHQREKEVRRQRAGEGKPREPEVSACYSPASSSSRTADETTPAERLRLMAGMVRPALPCGDVPLSAALSYEAAVVEGRANRVIYSTCQRVMEKSFSGGRSIVVWRRCVVRRCVRVSSCVEVSGLLSVV